MNNNIIGVFDSGVGGLTVFSKLIKTLPKENYVYYGDTKNLPYGSKTKEELVSFAKNIFDYYAKNGAKAVIMACNTTSATTYDVLKDDYDFEIYPVIQIASKCIASQDISRLGVLSTQATADSHAYRKEVQKHNPNIEVFEQGCPGWVQIVEEKTFDDKKSIELVKTHLDEMLQNKVDKIVLGCTHYPYLLSILEKFAAKDLFIDPAKDFVDYIEKDLQQKGLLAETQEFEPKFIVSANPENFRKSAQLFYEVKEPPILSNLSIASSKNAC